VLRTLEFDVRPLAARVLWNASPETIPPRSHMILAVDIGGTTYIADVGFGGLTLTAPLRLRAGIEQETPHELFRITGEDPDLRVEAKIGEDWRPLFRFDLSEQYEVDYAAPTWYLSTNPGSAFRTTLMAARARVRGPPARRPRPLEHDHARRCAAAHAHDPRRRH
jgi:N-hydroxyarylamine O-acetyltransferase